MSSEGSTESTSIQNLTEFRRHRVQSVHSLVIVRRPKQFSGPEINPSDIIITEKISDDEKSSYGAVLKGYCYGCPVAIKVIRANTTGDNAQLLEGFKEEVKLMSEITHPNVCLFLGACFGADHQILTSDGFLFLDDVLARVRCDARGHVADWRGLKVANYDAASQQFVYDEPCALVVRESAELVRFAAPAAGVDVCSTRDHELFVADGGGGGGGAFAKLKADEALKRDAVRFLAHAANGVGGRGGGDELRAALGLAAAQLVPFLELFGVWTAEGVATPSGGAQLPATPFVAERLAAFAAEWRVGSDRNGARDDDVFVVHNERLMRFLAATPTTGLPTWCWSLAAAEARAVVAGLAAADGGSEVYATSAQLRDDVVRLALHAGLAAACEQCGDGDAAWRVTLATAAQRGAQPVVRRGVDHVGVVANAAADRRVWCFAMPRRVDGRVDGVGGFVTTRRVAASTVSRPTIQGNCFDTEVMLVTELLEGDLTQLLKSDVGKSMTLFQKCNCARDIASGMAWLHHIQVVHLDLKPTNILYDSNRRMKVADFGLARFKSEDGYIPGACGGTPLYSAPEVLMKEDFTDKADVYSFSLIFAFILSGTEPYAGFTAWDDFFNAVVTKGHRPTLPTGVPKRIRRLIESCWAFDPDVRPSFIEILAILELALLDAAIDDPLGRRIWKSFFFDTKAYEHCTINRLIASVTWEDFMRMLETMLFIPDGPIELPSDLVDQPLGATPTDSQLYLAPEHRLNEYSRIGGEAAQRRVDSEIERRNRVIELQCLKTLLCKDNVVKVERFGFVCKLFGPIMSDVEDQGEAMLGRIAETMNQTWFHGDMSSTEAYTILRDKKPGSFLVRFSSSQTAFCISSVVSKSNKTSLNTRTNSSEDGDEHNTIPGASSSAGAPRTRPLSVETPKDRNVADVAEKWNGSSSSPSAAKKARPRVEDLQELDAVVHVMVERSADGFHYPGATQRYDTIVDLVNASDKLTRPCSVSKKRYGYIFSSLRASHYGYVDGDAKNRKLFSSGAAPLEPASTEDDRDTPPPPTAAPPNHKSHRSSKEKVPSRPGSTEPGAAAPAAAAPAAKPPVPSKPPPGIPAAVSISSNSKMPSPDVKRTRTSKKSKSSSALTPDGTVLKEKEPTKEKEREKEKHHK